MINLKNVANDTHHTQQQNNAPSNTHQLSADNGGVHDVLHVLSQNQNQQDTQHQANSNNTNVQLHQANSNNTNVQLLQEQLQQKLNNNNNPHPNPNNQIDNSVPNGANDQGIAQVHQQVPQPNEAPSGDHVVSNSNSGTILLAENQTDTNIPVSVDKLQIFADAGNTISPSSSHFIISDNSNYINDHGNYINLSLNPIDNFNPTTQNHNNNNNVSVASNFQNTLFYDAALINFNHPDLLFTSGQAPLHPFEQNFFIRAATFVTNLFINAQKPVVVSNAPRGDFGNFDNSATFVVPIVPLVSHQVQVSTPNTVFGEKSMFEDGHNQLFFVSPSALHPINSSSSAATVTLSTTVTGIFDLNYIMRDAGATVTPMKNGQTLSPGSIVTPPPTPAIPTYPHNFDLTLGGNDVRILHASTTVPTSIDAKVSVPAGAMDIYNIVPSNNTSIMPISDYSLNSTITALSTVMNVNATNQGAIASAGLLINSSDHLATILFNPIRALYYVDTSFVLHGQSTFGILTNFGSVIREGQYDYTKVADVNGDQSSDLLFGSHTIDGAILIYGSMPFPTSFSLANIPANVASTKFITPNPDTVGVPIANGAEPLDGGAALNALYAAGAGVNFIDNFTGRGETDILIEKHSQDYSYNSDIAYVLYGQPNASFPANVQLLPYGDSRLATGIVGLGQDSHGNFVKNINGFTITGPIAHNGTVAPDSFSLKSIGDMNGDGYGDLFALSNNNTAYLIFGHPANSSASSNINLGTDSPYVFKLFTLPDVASSTFVPTINDISSGYLNGDGLSDLLFTSAISVSDLQAQTSPLSKYLTVFTSSSGDALGSILSGAFLTDSFFAKAPLGSAYAYLDHTQYNTSHVLFGLTNQTTLTGFSGIDELVGGPTTQTITEHGNGATDPHLPGVVGSTLIGGSLNTTFDVADAAFHEVRGSATTFNTLILRSGTLDLTKIGNPAAPDLASQADHIVQGIERINLGDSASLIINGEHMLTINNLSQQGTTVGPGNVANLFVASQAGSHQNPNTAPTLTLLGDATHVWGSVKTNIPSIEGVPVSGISLFDASHNQIATVIVENNVHLNVH